jgi:hypothetical protein
MKFKEFIDFSPDSDYTKMRHSKPQIDDYPAFADDLHANNIDSSVRFESAEDLIPTQKNFNVAKVKKFYDNDEARTAFPVTISEDNFVVDGHHRWAASLQHRETVKCHCIAMTLQECNKFLKNKPYTSKRGVNEDLQH